MLIIKNYTYDTISNTFNLLVDMNTRQICCHWHKIEIQTNYNLDMKSHEFYEKQKNMHDNRFSLSILNFIVSI